MSAIIQENAIVHYEVLGHGKPVVFLHSWIGSWRYWIPSMQFASTRFRAYAVDFWGYGATKKISSRYSLEQQVALLNGFVKQMTSENHGVFFMFILKNKMNLMLLLAGRSAMGIPMV